jgi:hypothetical protein
MGARVSRRDRISTRFERGKNATECRSAIITTSTVEDGDPGRPAHGGPNEAVKL